MWICTCSACNTFPQSKCLRAIQLEGECCYMVCDRCFNKILDKKQDIDRMNIEDRLIFIKKLCAYTNPRFKKSLSLSKPTTQN